MMGPAVWCILTASSRGPALSESLAWGLFCLALRLCFVVDS